VAQQVTDLVPQSNYISEVEYLLIIMDILLTKMRLKQSSVPPYAFQLIEVEGKVAHYIKDFLIFFKQTKREEKKEKN